MRIFSVLLVCLVVTACGDDHKSAETGTATAWSKEAVTLKCPSGDCPAGVGAVIFRKSQYWGDSLSRCTATYVEGGKILTNSHCNKAFYADDAYFFALENGQTKYYRLDTIPVMDTGKPPESRVSEDPDLEMLQLIDIPNMQPRKISRKIPQDMTTLVAYSIYSSSAAGDFTDLHLTKQICKPTVESTSHHGLPDMTVSLDLSGCVMVPGNSGSPLFTPGDFSTVQVVINSTASNWMSANGNRVQCMDLLGIAPPEKLCTHKEVKAPWDSLFHF